MRTDLQHDEDPYSFDTPREESKWLAPKYLSGEGGKSIVIPTTASEVGRCR
jgi:hypothetical protein